nr:glycosyltransferase family 4 protein [uncultured Marinifilum sp.]
MKIVHIYWFGPKEPGGISNMLAEEVQNYPKSIKCYIIYIEDCDKEYAKLFPADTTIITLKRNKKKGLLGAVLPVIKLNLTLWKIKPDILVFQWLSLAKYILNRKIPKIGRIHNMNMTLADSKLKFDKFIAISNAVKKDVCKRISLDKSKVEVIYNGVYVNNFKLKIQKRLQEGKPFKIVQVSRLIHEVKAQDLVMRALKVCELKYEFKNWTYDIIGTGDSREYLEELAHELNISSKVNFVGQLTRAELYVRLSEYDLFTLPSYREGLGNVIVEAMAAKLPVLCSNIDGPSEIIENGKHGYLFKNKDVNDLAEKIYHISNCYGNEEMIQIVEEAYKFTRRNFDIQIMTNKLIETYKDVI